MTTEQSKTITAAEWYAPAAIGKTFASACRLDPVFVVSIDDPGLVTQYVAGEDLKPGVHVAKDEDGRVREVVPVTDWRWANPWHS